MNNKGTVSKYIREIRHFLPVYGHFEKRYLKDIQQAVRDYVESNENSSFDDLITEFGEPKDLVSNYILEQDAESLRKAIKFSGYIKATLLVAILTLLACTGIRGYAEYRSFQEAQKSYISREVIVINETEEQ